jgi:acetolactate synthase-1/2/3 large subunit
MQLVDALVDVLRALDVRYVFGVSGANIEHFHDAVHRLGDGRLTAVLAKREDGAANMADGRARVHRTLSVCCATSGGGMMNLAAGLAESHAQSVPVLALVGQPPTTLDGKGSFQDSSGRGRAVDAAALLASVTKRVERVTDPGDFWTQLGNVVEASLEGRMGPAALLLPRDMQDQEVGPAPAGFPDHLDGFAHRPRPAPGPVQELFHRLARARRPVLLLGHGVRRSTNPDAVLKFASRTRVPVTTTMGARGEYPNDDPLYLGVVGAGGHPSATSYLEDEADLVVLVGTGMSAMTRMPLRAWDAAKAVAVNIDPGDVAESGMAASVVDGDAGAVFEQLNDLLDEAPFALPPMAGYQMTRFRPALAPQLPDRASGPHTLRASEAVAIIENHLPRHGHLLYDAGNCSATAMHHSLVPPGCTSTIALGMGGMGYSFGAAAGAQLGSPPGTRTVVFCGDGAFLMSGLEIHTAIELGLPVLFVVFNNGMHGMCVTRQQTFFDARVTASEYTPVDIATVSIGLAEPHRLWVGRARTPDELVEVLADQRRNAHLPGVLELFLPHEEVPPFSSLLPPGGATVAVDRQPVHRHDSSEGGTS